ncbi:hypothetical protein AMTR_s00041p00226480 [Amborella trichopoda]|uniref:Uncharacterized protein n=1 Tax=Amborella trichopoda TaxID=13333 RepID=W1PYU2_AMBTC|nr:hypothetical protein AMTR_s00041p00226480 [Amborella trichopoda]
MAKETTTRLGQKNREKTNKQLPETVSFDGNHRCSGSAVLKKNKYHLIVFVKYFSEVLISEAQIDEGLCSVLDALKALAEDVSAKYAFKEEMMTSAALMLNVANGSRKFEMKITREREREGLFFGG